MTLLGLSKLSIKEIYHTIQPDVFPEVEHPEGRLLNTMEDMMADERACAVEENMQVALNEVFEDNHGEQYRTIGIVGSGTFSHVFKSCRVKAPGEFVAIKIVKSSLQYRPTGVNEVLIYHQLARRPDHPGKRFVGLPFTTFEIEEHMCIVSPLMARSLFVGINQLHNVMQILEEVRTLMKQLLLALAFVHEAGIIHCDVKPDNILYADDSGAEIRLVDFGAATRDRSMHGVYIQSRFYRSFEVLMGLDCTTQIDVWSAGCIGVELYLDFAIFACDSVDDMVHVMVALLGEAPEMLVAQSTEWMKFYDMTPRGFSLKRDPKQVLLTKHIDHARFQEVGAKSLTQLIMDDKPTKTLEESNAVRSFADLMSRLLEYDPKKRLTAMQACEHPFITGEPLDASWRPTAVKSTDPECMPPVRSRTVRVSKK